jgi:hypothetical protein
MRRLLLRQIGHGCLFFIVVDEAREWTVRLGRIGDRETGLTDAKKRKHVIFLFGFS